jgi:hypothetical protein
MLVCGSEKKIAERGDGCARVCDKSLVGHEDQRLRDAFHELKDRVFSTNNGMEASEQFTSRDLFALGRRQHIAGDDDENWDRDNCEILGKSVNHHGILYAIEGPTDRPLGEILLGRRNEFGSFKKDLESSVLDVRSVDVFTHRDAEHLTDSRHYRGASPRRTEHEHSSLSGVVILAND